MMMTMRNKEAKEEKMMRYDGHLLRTLPLSLRYLGPRSWFYDRFVSFLAIFLFLSRYDTNSISMATYSGVAQFSGYKLSLYKGYNVYKVSIEEVYDLGVTPYVLSLAI